MGCAVAREYTKAFGTAEHNNTTPLAHWYAEQHNTAGSLVRGTARLRTVWLSLMQSLVRFFSAMRAFSLEARTALRLHWQESVRCTRERSDRGGLALQPFAHWSQNAESDASIRYSR